MDLSDPSISLQTDIRKLKLELMRQELDDKILTLKLFQERQRQQNSTTPITTTLDPSEHFEYKPIGSILFLNVFGDFLVWHFVLVALFIWLILIFLIKYTCKFANMHKAKRMRRNTLKIKKELRAKNKRKEGFNNANEKNDDGFKQNLQISTISTTNTHNESGCVFDNSLEHFLPPKKDFFLYTIHEHEIQTRKNFTFKRKQQIQSFEMPYLNSLNRTLSKSDSNLLQIKIDSSK